MPTEETHTDLMSLKSDHEIFKKDLDALRQAKHTQANTMQSLVAEMKLIAMTLTGQNKDSDKQSQLLEKVLASLNGDDDRPGIRGRLSALESGQESLKQGIEDSAKTLKGEIDEIKGVLTWLIRTVVGGVILAVIAAFVRYYFFK